MSARALLETIAIHHSFLKRAETFAEKRNWKEIGDLVDAYAFSTTTGPQKRSKSEFSPPRIGEVVKDFITGTQPGKQEFWDQICDASHPNGATMMKYAGTLKDRHYIVSSASENDSRFFQIIFNTLFSCCWLIQSNLDFDILLAVIRNGDLLPSNHPLMKQKKLVDDVSEKVGKEIGTLKVGVAHNISNAQSADRKTPLNPSATQDSQLKK